MLSFLQAFWTRATKSPTFRKSASVIGGFAAGLWFAGNYWRQISATLDVWGVSHSVWMKGLVAVIAASGIATSIAASASNEKRQRANGNGDAPAQEPTK